MRQKIINTMTVIVILLLCGVVVGILVIDGFAQSFIQKQGSQGLGTQVTFERVHVGFFDMDSSFHGLEIANPEGFATEESPTLLSIDEADVRFGLRSLLDKPVAIQTATLSGITLHLEQNDEKSNIEIIVANVLTDESKSETDPDSSFTIGTLTMTDITVVASGKFTVIDAGSITTHIDEIVLHDVKAISDGEIAVEVITIAITRAIIEHLVDHPVEGLLKVAFSQAIDLIDELGKEIEDFLEKLIELID